MAMAERSAHAVLRALGEASFTAVGAPTLLETAIVLNGRRASNAPDAMSDLTLILARFEIAVLPFGQDHWLAAWGAFLRFGKGRHAADLNFGDCLTYAVAKLSGQPLLCVGGDFAQTDLKLVDLPH
jgi:ribonuclease VapC